MRTISAAEIVFSWHLRGPDSLKLNGLMAAHPYSATQFSYFPGTSSLGNYPTYSAAPVTSVPFTNYAAAPHTNQASIPESEGQAPEGTPLSAGLCQRLGVPIGEAFLNPLLFFIKPFSLD